MCGRRGPPQRTLRGGRPEGRPNRGGKRSARPRPARPSSARNGRRPPRVSRDRHLARRNRPAFGRRPAATASASTERNTASDLGVRTAHNPAGDCLWSVEPHPAQPSPRGSIQLPGSSVRALPWLLVGCRDSATVRRRLPRQLQYGPGLCARSSVGNGHPADRDARRTADSAQYRGAKTDRGGATRTQGRLFRVQCPAILRVTQFACVWNRRKRRSPSYPRSARAVDTLPVFTRKRTKWARRGGDNNGLRAGAEDSFPQTLSSRFGKRPLCGSRF
jgi:hypothetical protein